MTAYDTLPYPGQPLPQAHPRRLAMMAHLHGLPFPRLSSSRMLELGCGDGGHLLPIAAEFPSATLVGMDLSSVAIGKARELAERAGLGNVSFIEAGVENFSAKGPFDYIVAHGLYSWVPAEAREAILRLCSELLSDDGVAYISYNIHPGQKVREVARDLMLRMGGGSTVAALQMLKMAASARAEASPYSLALGAEWKRLSSASAHGLAHDTLGECHYPVYFSDFAREASGLGMHFFSEAHFASLQDFSLQQEARQYLDGLTDVIQREQCRDFFRGSAYRESLFARRAGELQRGRFEDLWVGCALQERDGGFVSDGGAKIGVDHPFARHVMSELIGVWPGRIAFSHLASSLEEREILTQMILRMTRTGVLDCDLEAWPYALRVSERPVATPLARAQAESGRVASLRHTPVVLDDVVGRRLLAGLDGSTAVSGPALERLLRLSLLVH